MFSSAPSPGGPDSSHPPELRSRRPGTYLVSEDPARIVLASCATCSSRRLVAGDADPRLLGHVPCRIRVSGQVGGVPQHPGMPPLSEKLERSRIPTLAAKHEQLIEYVASIPVHGLL